MNNEMIEVIDTNDLAPVSLIEDFKNPTTNFYSSMKLDGTRESKKAIFNALNNPEKKLSDCINMEIEMVDLIVEQIEIVDEYTGEKMNVLRTIIIDKNGVSYTAVSGGISRSLTQIIAIVGSPVGGAWHKEPVKVVVKQKQTRNGNNKVNTLEMV